MGRLKVRRILHQSIRDFLTTILSARDSLANAIQCGHLIEQTQQISIILTGVKGQYDSIVFVIHAICNPYDIESVSLVLLGAKAR